ncbi:hypothetical protein NP233_g2519 [Leucocoprinus birnbaumii]|uniref:Fe2OG dioxygenase domain-containing protein n=1 Tax=Leucocoprinus birnbaumii TaxID=56174 RepID=A0AAD5W036_9AGAR|nr:hypothetical protein NP233_g2519 [Leucocoprinus birnbaumii]
MQHHARDCEDIMHTSSPDKAAEYTDIVKVVDFRPFLNGSNKQAVADAILESFKTIGFVYLTNHGLEQEKIDGMFDMSRKFFALPHEQKMLAPHPPSGTHHRGYSAPGAEKVVQHLYDRGDISEARKRADIKESFEAGREDDELMPNIWFPEDILPGFRETCLQFFWDCFEVEKNILRALAIGFGLSEDYFVKVHTKPDNQLRLLHYPSVSTSALRNEEISRIDAHSDFGSITLLFQDDIGGLEVQSPTSDDFIPVRPVPGSLLLNAADFLMRWSNDTIKSTIHRVRAPPSIESETTPDRYSIPYFCCVDLETVVDCVPTTWSDEVPKKYEPLSVSTRCNAKMTSSHPQVNVRPWKPFASRPLLPIYPPSDPAIYPSLPSPPREQPFSTFTLSTHIVPAVHLRRGPFVPTPELPSNALSKDEKTHMVGKVVDKLVRNMKDPSVQNDKHENVLWNVLNRYVKSGLNDSNSTGLTLFFSHANGYPKETWEPILARIFASPAAVMIDEVWTWECVQHGDAGLINAKALTGFFDWSDNSRDIFNFFLHFLPSTPCNAILPVHLPRIPQVETDSRVLRGFQNRTMILVGHSFGGTSL